MLPQPMSDDGGEDGEQPPKPNWPPGPGASFAQSTNQHFPPWSFGATHKSCGPSAVCISITPCAWLTSACGNLLPKPFCVAMSATLLFASKLVATAGGAGVPWKRSAI